MALCKYPVIEKLKKFIRGSEVLHRMLNTENYASADGGHRSRVCARETLRSAPIKTSRNFPAHMSAESPSNISPNPSEVISEVSEP